MELETLSYFVKREHLIGDKPVPYELPCAVIHLDSENNRALVGFKMAADGMYKYMPVRADQVFFKLESV